MNAASLIFKHASSNWMLYTFCVNVSLFSLICMEGTIIFINIEHSLWKSENILLFHSEVFCPVCSVLFFRNNYLLSHISMFCSLYLLYSLTWFFPPFLCILGEFLKLAYIFSVIGFGLYWHNVHLKSLLSHSLISEWFMSCLIKITPLLLYWGHQNFSSGPCSKLFLKIYSDWIFSLLFPSPYFCILLTGSILSCLGHKCF